MEDERLKEHFHELAAKYSKETAHFSFSKPDHPAYQELVKMGEDIGPLVIECLIEKRHSPWLMLEMLYKLYHGPTFQHEEQGRLNLMRDRWITWARNSELFGLEKEDA